MYYIKKTMEVSGSHRLDLPYSSKCTGMHGHNWTVTVYCKSKELNSEGMILDYSKIKELIHDFLDHKYLNDLLDFNPTAENIAKWIVDTVPFCYRADVIESRDNEATYIKDEEGL